MGQDAVRAPPPTSAFALLHNPVKEGGAAHHGAIRAGVQESPCTCGHLVTPPPSPTQRAPDGEPRPRAERGLTSPSSRLDLVPAAQGWPDMRGVRG